MDSVEFLHLFGKKCHLSRIIFIFEGRICFSVWSILYFSVQSLYTCFVLLISVTVSPTTWPFDFPLIYWKASVFWKLIVYLVSYRAVLVILIFFQLIIFNFLGNSTIYWIIKCVNTLLILTVILTAVHASAFRDEETGGERQLIPWRRWQSSWAMRLGCICLQRPHWTPQPYTLPTQEAGLCSQLATAASRRLHIESY